MAIGMDNPRSAVSGNTSGPKSVATPTRPDLNVSCETMESYGDDQDATLPPGSPAWMRDAIGKPFDELELGLQDWIEDNEVEVHYRCAQDIKHCELELAKLQAKRNHLSFKEFETERGFLEAKIHATKSQQQRLADAKPADRLAAVAWIIEDQKLAPISINPSIQLIHELPPNIAVVTTKRAAEDQMLEWLMQMMRRTLEPSSKLVIKDQMKAAGVPEVSGRAFHRVWGEAARRANAPKWAAPGRRKESPQLITA